ncbi:hypothetical protein WR25_16868 [Diploscapter pachys]|uniref:CHK kinase-like domain-containing protein n=1 Tax=Diploscapter pachys TaxID=2018661 RepID=A0A2A2LDQ6_9BILA|nr:hypothetical protein WR25_16868 [Diploscapter pachys]
MFKFENSAVSVAPDRVKLGSKKKMEKEQVIHLIQNAFPENDISKQCNIHIKNLDNAKSFWSKIYQVDLHWKGDHLRDLFPKSVFVKLPIISDNVKNGESDDMETLRELERTLKTITKIENDFINMINNVKIPYFTTVHSYYVENITDTLQGGMVSKNLVGKAFAAEYIPGFNEKQVLRLMDALAGLHFWSITNAHIWRQKFGKLDTIDKGCTAFFLAAIIDFQFTHSGRITEDILRILQIGISPEDRKLNKDKYLKRYYNTLSELFNGKPPFSLEDVYKNYDANYFYTATFSLFGVINYFNMYNDNEIESCPKKREYFQKELLNIAKGIIDDIYGNGFDKPVPH